MSKSAKIWLMKKGWLKNTLAVGFVLVLGLLSFLYRFITNFPIGDDPAIHVQFANGPYKAIAPTDYPVPLFIFKALGQITHLPYEHLFVWLICSFLFLSSLALWLLVKKISGSNLIACFSALFFVSAYWVYDCLRMGLLPQTFSFMVLFLTLYFIVRRNILLTTIFSLLLMYSHPYTFAFFVLFFVLYAATNLIFSAKEDKIFVIKMLILYLIIGILMIAIWPEDIRKFSAFVNPEVIGWGERNFFVWFWASQPRRIFLALFAIIGLVARLKYLKEEKTKILYVLFFVGLFMAFNQYFGPRFQVFRFAAYLEASLVIFATYGVVRLVEIFEIKKYWQRYLSIGALSLFILIPQVYATLRVTYGMSQIPENNNSMSDGDQLALDWLRDNSTDLENIAAPRKWAIWIQAITMHTNVQSNESLYATGEYSSLKADATYIYWPTKIFPPKDQIFNKPKRFIKVFDSGGTVIFKVNYDYYE